MTKIFAISLNAGIPAVRNAITAIVTIQGWPVWHWQDDFWFVQALATYTPRTLYDLFEGNPTVKGQSLLLFEVPTPITYYGRADEAAWAWLVNVGKVSV